MKNTDLLIAANTLWVVVAAILVMFMQAGLRLPRGGPDAHEERRAHRRQERPHLRRLLARLLGGRLRDRLRRRQPLDRHERLRALGRLAARDRPGAVLLLHDRAGRGRLLLRGRLRRGLARDRLGRDGRAREALGLLRLRRALHADLLGHLALGLGRRLALRARDAGLRRLDGRALPGRARRARRRAAARPAHRQVRRRRRGNAIPGPQHPLRRPRHAHPLVRLVRLQPGLDARRDHRRQGRLLRLRRADDEPRGRGRSGQRRDHRLARAAQAGHLDDAERRARGAGRGHRGVRLRRAVGRGRDRPRLRA